MKDRMKDMVCFRCKQKGHYARDCSVKEIRELKQEQINQILEAHLSAPIPSSPSRPPVTVEEVADEGDGPPPQEQYYYEDPQPSNSFDPYYQVEDADNLYVEHEDFYQGPI